MDVFIYDTNPLERSSTSGNTAQIIDFLSVADRLSRLYLLN